MGDVLQASVELPTVIFTGLLAIVAVLWALSLAGVLDLEVDAADGAVDGALDSLDLAEVPATVLLTVFALAGWFVSVLASVFLLDNRSGTALAVWAVVIGILAGAGGFAVTLWLGPILGRTLQTSTAPSKSDLIGRIVEVRSQTVTESAGRGEATWPDGTVSTVDIRVAVGSDIGAGELRQGDTALLVDWIEATDDFLVGRLPPELQPES